MDWLETEIHREYHDAASLFPLMQGDEFDALKADIEQNGQMEAIWLHPDGRIIDGRNRHRACIEIEREPEFRTWNGDGSLVSFVVSLNLHRRHLNETQRATVASKIANMPLGGAIYRSANLQTDNVSRCDAAKMLNVSPRTVATVSEIEREAPDLLPQMEAGNLSAHAAKKKLTQRQREAEWDRSQNKPIIMKNNWPESINLLTGDFADVAQQLEPESIAAIITDPPYPREYLHLYGLLAEQAARLLKPGGCLLAMAGQSYLPEVLNLMTPHLNYHWTISYDTPGGQSPQIWPRKINTFWKPILWFVKGGYTGDWHGDKIKSDVNDNDKRFHGWGQSESGIGKLVYEFAPDGIILDPFVGGGTMAVICYRLRKSFIGIDKDPEAIRTTRARVIAEVKNARS